MTDQIFLWILFNIFILGLLAIDLGVFHRKSHRIEMREAIYWTIGWIFVALAFNWGVYLWQGEQAGLEFLTAYILERALSVDNIFVMLLIFSYFKVPDQYQHRVLFYGILGALVMRAFFIVAGVALIDKFHFMIYVFGLILVVSGIKMLTSKEQEIEPEKNPFLKLTRKIFPVTDEYVEGKFFVRIKDVLYATPLFVVLILIETTDLLFAVDSIPAVLGVSKDPLIIYSSNVFAILGLRAMYFAVAGLMNLFCYLNYGLSLILVLIGSKMLISGFYHVGISFTLWSIIIVLTVSIVASILKLKLDQYKAK